ncbi:MAG TPA: sugar phosphate isomerase/epimerase [Deinococcales bacterium]|nr:sugar phosphate isomerase/epimerase [Deinococcales bacterium]
MSIPVGIQLYTLREQTKRDFAGTLERVASLGLAGVEFAGYNDLPAGKLRDLLARLGLRAAASHVSLERLEKVLPHEIEYAREAGIPTLVCPWWNESDEAGWLRLSERLAPIAEACAAAGLGFAYHNHAHELTSQVGGRPALDAILAGAPGMQAELDVAWLYAGGVDPLSYLMRYSGRVPLLHLKDTRQAEEGKWGTLELGTGDVNLAGILGAAQGAGVQWLLIEQDHCPGDPFDSVQQSIAYLKTQRVL